MWAIVYTTDDASVASPTWIAVDANDVRSVTVTRGRDGELGRVDAGTAQLVLNNRERLFDPQIVTDLAPMNRWVLQAQHAGNTYPIFTGYAESYEQQWPATGMDAITLVRLVDEFKVLAMDRLPVMDPPTAQTYADVIAFDKPQGYWQFQDPNEFIIIRPTIGSTLLTSGTQARVGTPIIGDDSVENIANVLYGARTTTAYIYSIDGEDTATPALEIGGPGDASGLTEFSYEQWFKSDEATPAVERIIVEGPWHDADSGPTWALSLLPAGTIRMYLHTTTPALSTVTGTTSLTANTWYHIAVTYDGSFVRLFLNGVVENSGAIANAVRARGTVNQYLSLGRGTPGGTRGYDEVAFYRYAIDTARVLAHYTAGTQRGYPVQSPEDRCYAVMADSTSIAGTDFNSTIGREMIPTFTHGQSPLDELRQAEAAESTSAFLFVTKDGTVKMLQDAYEGIAPYNAVQATFDDDSTDLPYTETTVEKSETFLWNLIEISRVGGEVYTDSDAASVSKNLRRPLVIPALPIVAQGDIIAIAANLLARYKDPVERIPSISVYLKTSALIAACLDRDLGDLIRVLRTHPAGGARIDQELHIQSINLTAQPGRPWTMRFGVSP